MVLITVGIGKELQNYVFGNSVRGGIDIGRNVAERNFADNVALVGNCDQDV